jgi:2,5-furandicarboxylate decarboxylase 1
VPRPELRPDLRSFLDAHASALLELREPVSIRHELTALQHRLDAQGRFPVVVARRPRLADGSESPIPVVTNLTASRRLTAAALGLDDHRGAARWFAARAASPVEPVRVDPAEAPVREKVMTGGEVDLTRLPALIQHELEPGPYLTAAHATTRDPDSGVDNTAIQRCWLRGPRQMTWFPYPSSHNARNLRKYWAAGRPCPVAFWIGHHPAVVIGTQAKLDYPQSHWSAAGGVVGAPLRLVPSLTLGEDILVPAEAEIVIEGLAAPGQLGADGPFGEYTGYLGPQVPAPLVEVTCITMRSDALYHDYGSGLTDMLVPDNMTMEGRLYSIARAVAPSLVNVHVPTSGRRFHAWLQLAGPQPGEARDALAAVLAYRRLKTAVAVDEDVDIFDPEELLWALATRVQWARDSLRLDGLSTSTLDPSLPLDARTGSKLGVDATLPPPRRPGEPRPVPPRATVPAESLERARQLLAGADPRSWPHD